MTNGVSRLAGHFARDVVTGDLVGRQSVPLLHPRDGLWYTRGLADYPMTADYWGAAPLFHRTPFGGQNNMGLEVNTKAEPSVVFNLSASADPDKYTVANDSGGGYTDIIQRVTDPADPNSKVWKIEWNNELVWGVDAVNAYSSGSRRRIELRAGSNSCPFDTEMWAVFGVRLSSDVDWLSIGEGQGYFHFFQIYSGVGVNGGTGPVFSGVVVAPNRASEFYTAPNKLSLHLYGQTEAGPMAEKFAAPNLKVDEWIYVVCNFKLGSTADSFIRAWYQAGDGPLSLAVDHSGPWGWDSRAILPYLKAGAYFFGYASAADGIPSRKLYVPGPVSWLAADVPFATPQMMLDAVKYPSPF